MFNSQSNKLLSLEDLTDDFEEQNGLSISKQALDERFNDESVHFLMDVLNGQLSSTLESNNLTNIKTHFNTIRLKDSTRFGLPDEYFATYKGHGGIGKSMISIQYEFDLLSGNQIDLQLTTGRRNDQQDSKESLGNINANDLLIRDLGYVTTTYLKGVIKRSAFFLNRLPSQINVYDVDNENKEVDFEKLLNKMKKCQLPYKEINVLIGKKDKIPSRLIIEMADEKTYKSRLKK